MTVVKERGGSPDPEPYGQLRPTSNSGTVLLHRNLPADPESARYARGLIRQECWRQDVPELAQAAMLCTIEILANAIRHGNTTDTLQLLISRTGAVLRVDSQDTSNRPPRLLTPARHETSGRGLLVVATLTTEWGYDLHTDGGKTV